MSILGGFEQFQPFLHNWERFSVCLWVYLDCRKLLLADMNNMRHIIITVRGKLGLRWIWPRIEHRNAQFYTFSKAFLILPESAQSNYQGVKSLFHSYFRDILIMLDTSIYLSICMPICMSTCVFSACLFPFLNIHSVK